MDLRQVGLIPLVFRDTLTFGEAKALGRYVPGKNTQ